MEEGALGKEYDDGEIICRRGEIGDCMYVVQAGQVEVVQEESGQEVVIGNLRPGAIFGEMAIIDRQPRSATVRAKGQARVLTLDKRAFLRRVHEDPSLAFQILQQMSQRIRQSDQELSRLRLLLTQEKGTV
jgi:cAMP-binding proteins - catabolite gene activator and regulatory subunit of cAMP-dependent protein kinases